MTRLDGRLWKTWKNSPLIAMAVPEPVAVVERLARDLRLCLPFLGSLIVAFHCREEFGTDPLSRADVVHLLASRLQLVPNVLVLWAFESIKNAPQHRLQAGTLGNANHVTLVTVLTLTELDIEPTNQMRLADA